jgi:hypothetical protein
MPSAQPAHEMLQLAFARGRLSGENYALRLLRPGSTGGRPRCPYWCPLRALVWRIAFVIRVHEILHIH